MNMERAKRVADIINSSTNFYAQPEIILKGDFEHLAIVIGEKDSSIRANIYVEIDIYDDKTDEEIADKVIYTYTKSPDLSGIDFDKITNYEYIKSKLIPCLRPKTNNPNDIKTDFLDIEMYVRILISNNYDGVASVVVTKPILETWGVTENQIFKDAKANMEGNYTVEGITDFFEETETEENPLSTMLVLSNKRKMNGASVLTNRTFLNTISKRYGNESFYIIPSSIHEVISLPKSLVSDEQFLKMNIAAVNKSQLAPEDVLSYSVYYYDAENEDVKIAC